MRRLRTWSQGEENRSR